MLATARLPAVVGVVDEAADGAVVALVVGDAVVVGDLVATLLFLPEPRRAKNQKAKARMATPPPINRYWRR
jgi:hypothetical protein